MARGRNPHHKAHSREIAPGESYRLLITWPGQPSQRQYGTNDLAKAKSIARRNASNGARVDFQINRGWGRFETVRTYQPQPAAQEQQEQERAA